MPSRIRRINIPFPKKLVDELNSLVPPGKRSHLVVEASHKEVNRMTSLGRHGKVGRPLRNCLCQNQRLVVYPLR